MNMIEEPVRYHFQRQFSVFHLLLIALPAVD